MTHIIIGAATCENGHLCARRSSRATTTTHLDVHALERFAAKILCTR